MLPSRTVEGCRGERPRLPPNRLIPILPGQATRRVVRASLFALSAAICPAAFSAITTTGDVTPNPSGGTVVGDVIVGNTATGTLTVDSGSSLTANGLVGASNAAAVGTINIIGTSSGAQTVLNLLGPATPSTVDSPLQLGRWGSASMTVSNGGIMNAGMSGGSPSANCLQSNCNLFIGGSAGATGTLTLTGAGTTGNFAGGLAIGEAFVGSVAHGGFDLGTQGQNASGTLQIQNGAVVNSTFTQLGIVPTGFAELGTEQATGHVVVTGTGSVWNISANAVSGAPANLTIGRDLRGTGIVDVTNNGVLNVTGANSFVTVGNGGTGTLNVSTGGQVSTTGMAVGGTSTGVGNLTIGAGGLVNVGTGGLGVANTAGSSGTVLIDGGQLVLGQAFSAVGNLGNGSLTIQNGGQASFSALGIGAQSTGMGMVTVGNGTGQSVLNVSNSLGVGNLGSGQLTINSGGTVNVNNSGVGIAGSTASSGGILVNGGVLNVLGANALLAVGSGGTATMTVQSGGQVNAVNLNIGNSTSGPGSVTVGNGNGVSTITVSSSLVVGNTSTATSQLLVDSGGTVSVTGSNGVFIGNTAGSSGQVTVNGGQLSALGQNAFFSVGNSGTGTLTVQSGGQLSANLLSLGSGPTGSGTVNVIGTGAGNPAQTTVNLAGPSPTSNAPNLDIGAQGTANMTVSNGAIVNYAVGNANCATAGCGTFVGNGAGSTAHVTLTGTGTTMNLATGLVVGNAGVFTNFGTPGATTNATMLIQNGATLNTYQGTVSNGFGGGSALGTEHTIANVTVDGTGSTWNIARNASNGTQAQLTVGRITNATGTVDVTNGGRITITGSRSNPLTDNTMPGIAMGGTVASAGGSATINVSGAGSAIVINGDTGFINLGRNAGAATLNITGGGQVLGGTSNGLVNLNIARMGSTGTLNVDGVGSQLTLSGVCGVNTGCDGNGAFINIGRDAGSHALVNVTNGGKILVSDGGQAANNGSVGFWLGRDANSSATMLVSGAGSQVVVEQTGAGTANPLVMIGRAGTGDLTVTNGASLAVNGTLEREIIVGNAIGGGAAGGVGTLTVSNGATVSGSWFAVGNNSTTDPNGGHGTATIDNATVHIDGITINSVNNAITGGGIRVGRGPGSVGVLNLQNGAHITINTSTTTPEIYLGGTGVSPGGNGTITMSGGSSIAFTGTGATPNVVIGHSGTGSFSMTGGSTLTLPNDGSVVLGATSTGSGTLSMSGGSSIQTGRVNVGAGGIGAVGMVGAALNVTGNLIVGDAGSGTFAQNGGTNTIGGQLIIGNQATGNGNYQASNNASIALTGTSATARVIIGNAGTGALTLASGSTMTLAAGGSMIVGATATGSGNVFVDSTSSIQAGTFIGLGHDGTASTGGQGRLVVDGSVSASSLVIGANGCLGGNGVVHANVTMNGVSANIGACPPSPPPPILPFAAPGGPGINPNGILNPGRSPGRLVIDGGFDFISGTIVLEVESDGHGGFLTDQLVFSDTAPIDLTTANIEFSFLGNTDPNAFEASGLWDLDAFFRINDTPGFGSGFDEPISMGLGQSLDALFAQSIFEATSNAYVIENFTFTPEGGVGQGFTAIPIAQVPEPATWTLMMCGILLLYLAHMRRNAILKRRR
jgi:T5SS/PEP-CTERM-associated repeat protein